MLWRTDIDATTNLLASILQISQIKRCSNVMIDLDNVYEAVPLPVVAISDWLNCTSDDSQQERKLSFEIFRTQSLFKIMGHLEEVLLHNIWPLNSSWTRGRPTRTSCSMRLVRLPLLMNQERFFDMFNLAVFTGRGQEFLTGQQKLKLTGLAKPHKS